MDLKKLGEKLRYIRSILGMTQRELAIKANVKTLSVTRIEGGGSVSTQVLMNILTFYSKHVSIDVLFDDKAWEIAKTDNDMLILKTHINSIVEAKLILTKDAILKKMKEEQEELVKRSDDMIEYMRRSMKSAIRLIEE